MNIEDLDIYTYATQGSPLKGSSLEFATIQ
jgi:hypothetical protein